MPAMPHSDQGIRPKWARSARGPFQCRVFGDDPVAEPRLRQEPNVQASFAVRWLRTNGPNVRTAMRPVGETAASARDTPEKAGSMTSGAWPDDALYDLQAEV